MLYYGGEGQVLPIGVGVRCQVLPTFLASSSPLLMTWQLLPTFLISSTSVQLFSTVLISHRLCLHRASAHFFSTCHTSSRIGPTLLDSFRLFELILNSFHLFSALFILTSFHFSPLFWLLLNPDLFSIPPTTRQPRLISVHLFSHLFISFNSTPG